MAVSELQRQHEDHKSRRRRWQKAAASRSQNSEVRRAETLLRPQLPKVDPISYEELRVDNQRLKSERDAAMAWSEELEKRLRMLKAVFESTNHDL